MNYSFKEIIVCSCGASCRFSPFTENLPRSPNSGKLAELYGNAPKVVQILSCFDDNRLEEIFIRFTSKINRNL